MAISGSFRFIEDIALLVNNPKQSDVQFKVGGGDNQEGGEPTTIYAHSIVLRCRSKQLDELLEDAKKREENFEGIIYIPHVSPEIFLEMLQYIYTGSLILKTLENIIELMVTAEKMELEELMIDLQNEYLYILHCTLNGDSGKITGVDSIKQRLPVEEALQKLIFPTLILAKDHNMSHFVQQILSLVALHLKVIIASPEAYDVFLNQISQEDFIQILSSDDLFLGERKVWDLALDWACCKANLLTKDVLNITNSNDSENNGSRKDKDSHVSATQFKELIETLLPYIRFTLLTKEEYIQMAEILTFFLTSNSLKMIHNYFLCDYSEKPLDSPRATSSAFQCKCAFGHTKLIQDFSILINESQFSDIQFQVSDTSFPEDNINETTIYAHSLILRSRSKYFEVMLDEEKGWRESSNGVINKPNISSITLLDVLCYIYGSSINLESPESIFELISAAEEMELEELNLECQKKLIDILDVTFSSDNTNTDSTKKSLSILGAVQRVIFPVIEMAESYNFQRLAQQIFSIIHIYMDAIVSSPDAYTFFLDRISFENLIRILKSDDLFLTEDKVFNLALSWACHKTNLSKHEIIKDIKSLPTLDMPNTNEDRPSKRQFTKLDHIRKYLEPLLLLVRTRFEVGYGLDTVRILLYFLQIDRFSKHFKLITFNGNAKDKQSLEEPRFSKILKDECRFRVSLRRCIFQTGGITGCLSAYDLKFKLLFRASEHDFSNSTFHERCDIKGPTLVIIRTGNDDIVGGVNFNDWKSDKIRTFSSLNFLFRNDPKFFKMKEGLSTGNSPSFGPVFGDKDDSEYYIEISGSNLIYTFRSGFRRHSHSVDYEVFALSDLSAVRD